MATIDLTSKNVILMLGETNEFFIEIDGKYYPTKYRDVCNYHVHLWLTDKTYKEETAKAILEQWFHEYK